MPETVEAKPREETVDIEEEQAEKPALVEAPSLESISSSRSLSYIRCRLRMRVRSRRKG
jgi:hypothetical protein